MIADYAHEDEWRLPDPERDPGFITEIIGQLGFWFDGITLRIAVLCRNYKLSRTRRAS